mgnify:CR=1 FL=1|jgi:hypothetical protein
MKNLLLRAAVSHYEAQRDEAIATLNVYFDNPVGIGEHSNILCEIKKWTTQLAGAEENLAVLKTHFTSKP